MLSLLAAALDTSSAFVPGTPMAGVAVRSTPVISMNTGYTDISQIGRKKNPNSGRSTALKGYTVGSLAPPLAKSSGTRITDMGTGYGIANRWGGQSRAAPAAAAASSSKPALAGFVGDEAPFVVRAGLASQ